MVFPELKNKRYGYVNHNIESERWIKENKMKSSPNPLLDPAVCQKMIDALHIKFSVDFSYGGWMEDRSFLWHGSYLDEHRTYTHLGVDINVPSGTRIATDFDATVIKIDDDYPENGGWGPRVILKHSSKPIYMIYAHLDREILFKVGDKLKKDTIFANVGHAPYNGNWFPHLHVQAITEKYFNEIESKNLWGELDGYGLDSEISINSSRFPDPSQFINLQ